LDLSVPHLFVSTHTFVLQGHKLEQAEGQNQIDNQSSRQASATVERKNISCERDTCGRHDRSW